MSAQGKSQTFVPEFLYHTYLKVDEHGVETKEVIPRFYVLGTHATVESAKNSAATVIPKLGYEESDFDIYEERPKVGGEWKHGDGVVVYAKAPAGQEFFVGIDTKLNSGDLPAKEDGSLVLPQGVDHLHYVLQTVIEYRGDDQAATTEIQGSYVKRTVALEGAKSCLLDSDITEGDFAEYDARDDLGERDDWPYGEDVLVHAVANSGENYLVSVKSPPSAYLRHSKHKGKSHKT
jgi:hypothetical protein